MLLELDRVVRMTNRPYVLVPGWKDRGHADMNASAVLSCVGHHDASNVRADERALVNQIRDGRPDLAGPLAQLYIGRSSTIYVVAAGLCYHAGAVRSTVFTNPHSIGIEAGNNGIGEPWPVLVMDSYRALVRALMQVYGFTANRFGGHLEVCAPVGRKRDPAGIDLNAFRVAVAKPAPVPPPAPVSQTTPFESPEDAMYSVTLPAAPVIAPRSEVIPVPEVGAALSLGPKGKVFVGFRPGPGGAVLQRLVVTGTNVHQELAVGPLLAGAPRVLEMPPGAVQVEVTYTAPNNFAALVEPIPATI